uniref:Uncharacterized protein n=1 Tax=Astyanax mexicanus TaxID=7994 RepID=A0A3B1J8Y8_ASTMX
KEEKLPRTERPDRGLEGLQSAKGASMGGGSLPDSPRADEDFIPDFSCRCPGFYRGYLGQKPREQSPALRTMSRVVAGVVFKHGIAYNGMVQKLNLEEQDDSMDFISSVAKTLFSDGNHELRILSLVASVCVDMLKKEESRSLHHLYHFASLISLIFVCVCVYNVCVFVLQEGFVEFSEVKGQNLLVKSLKAVSRVAGLGFSMFLLHW